MTKRTIKSCSVKSLAIFLSVLMIFYLIPATAYASLFEATGAESVVSETSEHTGEIFEDVSRREENVKHFRLEDGTYMAAQYDTAVHTLDENGEWQDIDNTLSESGSEYSTSNARIKFAKKITGNESIFTLHENNRKITLSLDGAIKKATGVATNTETEFDETATTLQKMMTLDKLSSRIIYENILNGVDLEYIVNGNNIKENIIVKEKKDSYVYSFTMKLNNLTAVIMDDGSIIICDESSGEAVYTMPAPVMWDSAYNTSNAASMTLTALGNGSYTITVAADSEWMNSAERTYPVTIDPPIYTSSSSSIIDLDLDTSDTEYTAPESTSLYVDNDWVTYWKLTSLPSIPNSAYITNADFSLTCFTTSAINGYVAAYDVLNTWDSSLTWGDVLSSTAGNTSTTYIDYHHIFNTENDGNASYTWVITPIVKKWYAGQNYGLMLAPANGTTFVGTAMFHSSEYATVSKRPQLCIEYRDMKGIEDYWSFSSQSAGFAGSGSINNATGNLVFTIPTLTTTDALMPITVSLVYNSSLYNQNYKYPYAQMPFTRAYAPYGFKLSIDETLLKRSFINESGSTEYYYIWADGDGTEHYFMPTETSNTYTDEDGLRLTLVENNTICTITDASDNVRTFTNLYGAPTNYVSGWYLSSIADKNGNKVVLGVNSSYSPTTVSLLPNGMSTSITQLKLSYTSSGLLYAIWNPNSGDGVVFRYNGNYLSQVIRAHGGTTEAHWNNYYNNYTSPVITDATANYSYNSNGELIKITNNLTKYQIAYLYSSSKIIQVQENAGATSAVAGQKMTIGYNSSSTVIRTSGTNDIFGDSDDLLTNYGFDTYGRNVSCYTTDLNKSKIYGASNGQYVGEDNPNAKNSLKSSVQTGYNASNFVLNGGFEASSALSGWSYYGLASVAESNAYIGQNSAMMRITPTNSTTYISQNVMLEPGNYSLSLYVNTVNAENATLTLKVTSSGSIVASESLPVNKAFASAGYTAVQLDFSVKGTTPSTNTITLQLTGSVTSTAYVNLDNVMLSKTIGAAEYDMVQMGHFENGTTQTPRNYWSIFGSNENITLVNSGNNMFDQVLMVNGTPGNEKIVQQTIYQAKDWMKDPDYTYSDGSVPKLYTISGWAKGTSQCYSDWSTFCLAVDIQYYDGTSSAPLETFYFDFCNDITDWQFVSGGFATNPANGIVDTITVYIYYFGHAGYGYFDGITVTQNSTTTNVIKYNSSGTVKSSQNGSKIIWCKYDDDDPDKLIRTLTSSREFVEYTYDSNDNVIKETHSHYKGDGSTLDSTIPTNELTKLIEYTYSYNNYGQLTYSSTSDFENSGNDFYSITTYNTGSGSHIFGTVSSEVDTLAQTTQYFYNTSTGQLLATIYSSGEGVAYDYDEIGNLRNITPAYIDASSSEGYSNVTNAESVTYGYHTTTQQLYTITTKSTTYTLTPNVFGNTTEIKAGNYILATYNYNSYNGKVNTLTYESGLVQQYIYDALDRISEIKYNIGTNSAFITVYTYTYDTAGNLFSVEDHVNNEVTVYNYDGSGKLMRSYIYDSNTYTNLFGSTVYYDDESRVSFIVQSYDYTCSTGTVSDALGYSYYYDDETSFISDYYLLGDYVELRVVPQYDNFGKTATRTITATINSTQAFYNRIVYSYKTVSNYESALVSQYASQVNVNDTGITTTVYNYTYDNNGNITTISNSSGVVQYKYTYDDLGQLIREDNRPFNASYEYIYDKAGNILYKKTYAFTTGTLGTAQSTVSYEYGDTTWGDLLTEYNDPNADSPISIEYDSIGNPISIDYGSDTVALDWEGRQLVSISDAGSMKETTFAYNADGIRTYLCIDADGEITEKSFILNGSQIVVETVSSDIYGDYSLTYLYDENGAPIGLKYREPTYAKDVYKVYFFEKNLQGDIIAIYNEGGGKIGTYSYDAWGNFIVTVSSGITTLERAIVEDYNPYRYRGYYFDIESGWYYLQSRYYNPEWGRFISPDHHNVLMATPMGLTDKNLFAYCDNNPTMRIDENGEFWNIVAGAVIGAAINIGVSYFTTVLSGGKYTLENAIVDGLSGAVTGAFAATGLGAIAQGLVGMVTSGAASLLTDMLEGKKIDVNRAINAAALGGLAGYIGGAGLRANPAVKSADQTCRKVLQKVTSGQYATVRGAKSAMTQAINRIHKALKPAVIETACGFIKSAVIGAVGMYVYDRVNP